MKRQHLTIDGGDLAETSIEVERSHRCAHHQAMILEIGNSKMPVAPASFNAGMSVLIWSLATTVSTANPASWASTLTVGSFIAGSSAITPSNCAVATLSLTSTL